MKLSIITVTYNAEKTLERTLKSVQGQTYHSLEHLIVDGASRDGTVELIRKYADERGDLQNGEDEKQKDRKASCRERV